MTSSLYGLTVQYSSCGSTLLWQSTVWRPCPHCSQLSSSSSHCHHYGSLQDPGHYPGSRASSASPLNIPSRSTSHVPHKRVPGDSWREWCVRCTAVHQNRPQPYCLRYALTPGWRVEWHEPQVVSGSPCVAVVCLRASTRASSSNPLGMPGGASCPLSRRERAGGEGPRDAWTL